MKSAEAGASAEIYCKLNLGLSQAERREAGARTPDARWRRQDGGTGRVRSTTPPGLTLMLARGTHELLRAPGHPHYEDTGGWQRLPCTYPPRLCFHCRAPLEGRTPQLQGSRALRLPARRALTFHGERDGLAGLIVSVLVVHGLHVVPPRVGCHRRQDDQGVVQRDGSGVGGESRRHSISLSVGTSASLGCFIPLPGAFHDGGKSQWQQRGRPQINVATKPLISGEEQHFQHLPHPALNYPQD